MDVLGALLPMLVDAVQSIKQSIKREFWSQEVE